MATASLVITPAVTRTEVIEVTPKKTTVLTELTVEEAWFLRGILGARSSSMDHCFPKASYTIFVALDHALAHQQEPSGYQRFSQIELKRTDLSQAAGLDKKS